MFDKQLYTSDGTNLITVGSTAASLSVSDSIRIGDISTSLMSINAIAIFTGNVNTNTSINTTSISVQNATSNSSLNPTTIFVGNTYANIALDVTGGLKTIEISFANIGTTGVATIQTVVNHGIDYVTQSKLYVNTSQVSLNTANYSSDYNPAGFNIIGIPSPNTILINIPTSDFKYKWGDRSIQSISRNESGVVTITTKGLHLYQPSDKAYVTNVKYDVSKKAPFTVLDSSSIPIPNTLTVLDPVTVSYTQSQFISNNKSLIGYTLSFDETKDTFGSKGYKNVYLNITGAISAFAGFNLGDPITLSGFQQILYRNSENSLPFGSFDDGGFHRISPSYFNGTKVITNISYNSDTIMTISVYGIQYYYVNGPLRFNTTSGPQSSTTLTSGYIAIDYTDTGVVTQNSQLCPALANSSIGGVVYATNPTGISIKNGSKLIYVLDNAVYVGNSTIGNIIDVSGSRVFKPSTG
jgi:hypothetical protein